MFKHTRMWNFSFKKEMHKPFGLGANFRSYQIRILFSDFKMLKMYWQAIKAKYDLLQDVAKIVSKYTS